MGVVAGLAAWLLLRAPPADPRDDLERAHTLFAETARHADIGRADGFTEDQIAYCQRGFFGDQTGGMARIRYPLALRGQSPEAVAVKVAGYWQAHGEELLGGPVTVDSSDMATPGVYGVHMHGPNLDAYVEVAIGDGSTYVFTADGACGSPAGATVRRAVPDPTTSVP